jgi:2-dehydropantoate 2-reductase
MKIAVLGSGGIGGFVGGALAKSGNDVWFIARGNHLQAMREHGLSVDSIALGKFQVKVKATDKPSDIGPVDLILFSVKSYDTESALQEIRPLVGNETVVLSFQNGVDNEDKIAEVLGKERVLGGIISVESYIAEPGKIAQTMGPVRMAFGELDGRITPRATMVHEALVKSGLKCELSDRIEQLLWEKLLFISAAGGVCSVCRAPIGDVLGFENTRELFIAVLKEVESVARARGINLPADIVPKTLAMSEKMNKATKPSMLRDLERGKRLEVDALNGAVSKFGHQLSVPTPAEDFICACLKLQDRNVGKL